MIITEVRVTAPFGVGTLTLGYVASLLERVKSGEFSVTDSPEMYRDTEAGNGAGLDFTICLYEGLLVIETFV